MKGNTKDSVVIRDTHWQSLVGGRAGGRAGRGRLQEARYPRHNLHVAAGNGDQRVMSPVAPPGRY